MNERLGPDELGEWRPLSVEQVSDLLHDAPFRWWIAGGWAIDLFLRRTTRPHTDIEIAVLRQDQLALRAWLREWELWYVPGPGIGLVRWREAAPVPPEVHELWCREERGDLWRLEVLYEEATDGRWYYRRDAQVTRPLADFGIEVDGVPVIRPEIALLYKSKHPRARDEADLRSTVPHLDAASRVWLADALTLTGSADPWTGFLEEQGT